MTNPEPTNSVSVFTWRMAEILAVEHMRIIGFIDAQPTIAGADGGLDAISLDAVAQVKHHTQPVGAPDVQRLRGAAHGNHHALFYSSSGYTAAAIIFADTADVALFQFDAMNTVTPANAHGSALAANHRSLMWDRKAAYVDRLGTVNQIMLDAFEALKELAVRDMPAALLIDLEGLGQRQAGVIAVVNEVNALDLATVTLEELRDYAEKVDTHLMHFRACTGAELLLDVP
ncbi:restriction endonuclease [Cryobacterium sp. Hh7]|uniref:restriction endonuclease n=1 Tax=Cryobacterium sp. Hh7 TaxID=1259159 RepID=UPI001069CABD|nr:restriction endonuclease [Cryobacterium sp. Hh7]TFD53488.1 restriction endonuclease [Cryobacterium sp. Hh7]